MALDSQQKAYLTDYRLAFRKIAEAIEEAEKLYAMYFDRTYGSGGANEITDADLTAEGLDYADIDASSIASGITAIEQLKNYRDNAAVSTGDYGATINKLRRL